MRDRAIERFCEEEEEEEKEEEEEDDQGVVYSKDNRWCVLV
jgi:hypothetical protein